MQLATTAGYYGILNDMQIAYLCKQYNFIKPFTAENIKERIDDSKRSWPEGEPHKYKVLSYGVGSYGYDFTLSDELYLKENKTGEVINVKDFNIKDHFEPMRIKNDDYGDYVILPPHSFVLGRTVETVKMPPDVMALCFDKSTYARVGGVQTNITPLEPGWTGTITIEIRNTLPDYTRLYVNEGIIQAVFFRGLKPAVTYRDKEGKYQDQKEVTGPKV